VIAVRESIFTALKAALLISFLVAGALSVVLLVQSIFFKDPALFDSDGDGFTDTDEWSWWTSRLDPYDNPFTTRMLPILLSATIIAVVLVLVKARRRRTVPVLSAALLKKISAMKAAVRAGNRGSIDACKMDFDAAIAELREGPDRGMLHEPLIQEILVEFEVLCLDVFIDGAGRADEKIT